MEKKRVVFEEWEKRQKLKRAVALNGTELAVIVVILRATFLGAGAEHMLTKFMLKRERPER
jgi:hypothetical protein